jgi:hypothetical protein
MWADSWARVRDWFLVEADRLFVALAVSIAVALGFLVLAEIGFIGVVNDDSITRLAGGMIAGTFSLVTLVVSINQLIFSREFTAAGLAGGADASHSTPDPRDGRSRRQSR